MIFVGDIALPYRNAVNYNNINFDLCKQKWVGNLEGAIISASNNTISAVYNNESAIIDLISKINFTGFVLANNHIFDIKKNQRTIDFLKSINLAYCGIGDNLYEAAKPLIIEDNGTQIVILNFGWEVIQCEIASKENAGVNPIKKDYVLKSLKDAVVQYSNAIIIPFMHWGYELESEPQPFERELAKKMIEMGAAGVIGAHSHRVGGFEIYNGKPIIYSLGNWLFKQNYYYGKNLSFPDFCNLELAFEWNFETEEYLFHFFEYDRELSQLTYLRTEGKESKTMTLHTPFRGLSNNEYKRWYRQYHYHKKKGLPIYYWEDHLFILRYKNMLNKLRDKLLIIFLKKGK